MDNKVYDDRTDLLCKLIDAVKKQTVLYEKDAYNKFSKHDITNAWKTVARETGLDADTALKKWTLLRDYYRRVYTRWKQDGKTSKWWYYNRLNFLSPHLHIGLKRQRFEDEVSEVSEDSFSSAEGVSVSGTLVEAVDDTGTLKMETHDENNEDADVIERDDSKTSFVAPRRKSKFKSKTNLNRGDNAFDKGDTAHEENSSSVVNMNLPSSHRREIVEAVEAIYKRVSATERKRKLEEDEDELFFRSLLPKLKMMDVVTKLDCQTEIQTVVLKHLKRFVKQDPPQAAEPGLLPQTNKLEH